MKLETWLERCVTVVLNEMFSRIYTSPKVFKECESGGKYEPKAHYL